jgi:hypothetical protein
MVRVEEPEPETVDGLQVAEVRDGKPLTLRETIPAKPWSAATETVSVPLPPRVICRVVGESDIEKSPAELTINVTFAE